MALIVHFRGSEVYVCAQSLPLSSTNIPKFVQGFDQMIHWRCQVIRYTVETQSLHLEVLQYNTGVGTISEQQQNLYAVLHGVRQIYFRAIDTARLLDSARSFRTQMYQSAMTSEEEVHDSTQPQILEQVIEVGWEDLTIDFGGIFFTHRFKGYRNPIEVFVANACLRPEFDAIKSYFKQSLAMDKLRVNIKLEQSGDYLEVKEALSPDLDHLDDTQLEQVRFQFVQGIKHTKLVEGVDKSLFTMDEYFGELAPTDFRSDTFHKNPFDLLQDFLRISDSKHYRQLTYLSSRHASHVMKLRFIVDPVSFLFLIEGRLEYHLIWETLDTEEATYIWHAEKSKSELKRLIKRVDAIICSIRISGKIAYLSSHRDRFSRIVHDYSNVVDGFVRWKGKLESVLA